MNALWHPPSAETVGCLLPTSRRRPSTELALLRVCHMLFTLLGFHVCLCRNSLVLLSHRTCTFIWCWNDGFSLYCSRIESSRGCRSGLIDCGSTAGRLCRTSVGTLIRLR